MTPGARTCPRRAGAADRQPLGRRAFAVPAEASTAATAAGRMQEGQANSLSCMLVSVSASPLYGSEEASHYATCILLTGSRAVC